MDFRGHDQPWRHFSAALESGKLHHGWILAGLRGMGKSAFALRAAAAIVDPDNQHGNLIANGSHPDIITVKRLSKDTAKDDDKDPGTELKRSIGVDQIRAVQTALTTRPGLSSRRAIIIDSADDMERSAANALLKSLEEPPAGTYFLLVSHASDRLLPTIRSRCQMLRFEPLSNAELADVLREAAPEASEAEIAALVSAGGGSPGQALEFLELDIAEIENVMTEIIQGGDRSNALRTLLAEQLALKAAQTRYEAFLRRVPSRIAEEGRRMDATAGQSVADAWAAANALAGRAIALTLDKQSVVMQMGSLLASLGNHKAAPR